MPEVTPPAPQPAPDASSQAPAPAPSNDAGAVDQKEWDDAVSEIFPGIGGNKPQENPNDKTQPQANEGQEAAPEGDQEQGAGEEEAPADEESDEEGVSPQATARDTRVAQREAAAHVEAIRNDVRTRMFKDAPDTWRDADGDEIRSAEDIMKLINPRTNQQFDDPLEAQLFFNEGMRQFKENQAALTAEVDRISNIQAQLGDDADSIREEYGELFKTIPGLQQRLWQQWVKGATVDKSGIITNVTQPLGEFYRAALEPIAELARKAEQEQASAGQGAGDGTQPNGQETQVQQPNRQQRRADRSDIFGGGNTDQMSDEEKEWDAAAKAYFGPMKR